MMEDIFLKKDRYTAEYRFARDIVAAVVEMRAIYAPPLNILQLDKTFFTVAQRITVRELFSKEWTQLDEHVKRYTVRNGQSNYSDERFLLCVVQFIEKYKPSLKSEKEFLLVCSRIAFVAACFLKNNAQSDAVNIAVDRVYEILIDTFYSTSLIDAKPLIKDIQDQRYRFSYHLLKTLVEMRGIKVPDLELPDPHSFILTENYKNKIKFIFCEEWTNLDELIKAFTCKDDGFDFCDENISRCMDEIVIAYGFDKNTDEQFVLLCARVAYVAAWCLRKNYRSNATQLALDRIHQMVKNTVHFNKYKQDNDYRFACDLVEAVVGMRSNILSVTEMSHSNKFFMIAHQNKIEEILLREKPDLDKIIKKEFTDKYENLAYDDEHFRHCLKQISDLHINVHNSREEMVIFCAKIAYVATCFLWKNNKSNAPGLVVTFISEKVKNANHPSNFKDKVFLMHMQDPHYRLAYDLVKTVLEIKNVPVYDSNPIPDSDNFLFTSTHRYRIEKLLSKEFSELNKIVEEVVNRQELLDYGDNNFIRCMQEVCKECQKYQKTEDNFLKTSAKIAFMSACFLKQNIKSNAAFLAVNRIYEMSKAINCFNKLTLDHTFLVNVKDDHYRFAYDLVQAVFEIKNIPVFSIDLPDPVNCLFSDDDGKLIEQLLFKEWSQLDKMVANLVSNDEHSDYSDCKFLQCIDQIAEEYESYKNTEEGFVYGCARIAYTAANFFIKNFRSNATFLAINRIYEMSKDSFHLNKRIKEETWIKYESFHFAYDLVQAGLQMSSNSSEFKIPDSDYSPFTKNHRNEVQFILSIEWPCFNHTIRKFAGCSSMSFSDNQFLQFLHRIINTNKTELKSEKEQMFLYTRIAYAAMYFLRKNEKSNAAELAVDRIYRMRKNFCRIRNVNNVKSFSLEVGTDQYHFAHDLVRTVMELTNTPVPDLELPDPNNVLFTSQHRKKIKKLLAKESFKIDNLIEKLTNREGISFYSDDNFLLCIDRIFKEYKHEQDTKIGFVRVCARIAYPVSLFIKHKKSNALTLAINQIYEMTRNTAFFNKDLEDKSLKDVKDDKYRFAYDLVKTAVEIQGAKMLNTNLPNPSNILFTKEHKQNMEVFFSKEGQQLADLTKKLACKNQIPDYSDRSFSESMDQVVKEYKPESYSEEGFIILCSRIAYVAAFYFEQIPSSNATHLAVERIHEMVNDIFSRGTLSQSCW